MFNTTHVLFSQDQVGVVNSSMFGDPVGPIFMDQVHCDGGESSLFNCNHLTIPQCSHDQDVAIVCHRK